MRTDTLLAGEIEAWLRPAPRPPLWLFVHVPKTAGSSLASDIAGILSPYRSIHIDHTDRSTPGPERFDRATDAFIAEQGTSPAAFASGHVQWRHVARIIAAVPGMQMFTMLREPAARLVSDFLYQRSAMHPLAAEMRARIPDFDAFIELPGQQNRIARHLVPRPLVLAGDPAPCIQHLRKRFAFVGVQERYELCFRALTARLGRQIRPAARKRVNDGAEDDKAAVMARLADPAVRARVAELNAVDFAIHADVAAAWDRIAAPLQARLDQQEAVAA